MLWEARQAPWENGVFNGPGSGVYKTTDGGTTWRPIVKGLPTFADDGLGRIGITVAPSNPRRLFATVEAKRKAGLYRSDDAGESWALINADPRVTDRASDFAEVKVHPQDPDTVFTASIVTWKSTDGGRTFTALRGAPGGDDYHRIWINPRQPDIMLIAADQGVIITVNGGRSWSSWYNQPTAQLYHVSTDNAFPYREPRRRRADHLPRMAPGGGGGIRLRRRRPPRPRHRLRRQAQPLRPPDEPDPDHRAAARAAGRRLPRGAHGAGAVLPHRPAHSLLRVQRGLEDG